MRLYYVFDDEGSLDNLFTVRGKTLARLIVWAHNKFRSVYSAPWYYQDARDYHMDVAYDELRRLAKGA